MLRFVFPLVCVLTLMMTYTTVSRAQTAQRLPGTDSLRPDADQLTAQRKQVFDYFDRRIAAAQDERDKLWQLDFSSPNGYQRSLEDHRASLKKMLGLIDRDKDVGEAKTESVCRNNAYRIERVTIPITEGLAARGLLFTPHSSSKKPATIICPDADTWPERLAETSLLLDGLSVVFVQQSVERLVDHPYCEKTRGKDRRTILYRLGYVVGRTMPGLDVQDTLAVVDFLSGHKDVAADSISLTGRGQGGMTALLTAALDSRISEVTVTDYFDCRNRCWAEPVDRRLRNQLREFGDAELAALIAPRRLTVNATEEFLRNATAFDSEVQRAARFYKDLSVRDRLAIVKKANDETSVEDKDRFAFVEEEATSARNTHFEERLTWLRKQIDASEAKRYARWKILQRPVAEFPDIRKAMLDDYRRMVGELPDDGTPMNVRSELVLTTDKYRAYRVTIDVREGVDVYGHLLIPLGRKGKRPAVICQHGFGGFPRKITGVGVTDDTAYHEYGRKLAEKGYVVFAPTLLHIKPSEEVSKQMRQANAVGMMRLAMPVAKTKRVIDFLETLPSVDKNRIGYYGLSYGGYSAIWMTPLLERVAVSIISGNFNDWRTKITSDEMNTSYLRHPDEDMYSWNCLHRFTHPELIAMMTPRRVAIEYGNKDGITTPAWTAYAWKQTKAFRDHLGHTDRIHLFEFDGPHEIHGVETFEFLDRWLKPDEVAALSVPPDPSAHSIKVESDFPGGSAVVTTIDQQKNYVRLDPAEHPDRGWRCWWYVKLTGLPKGEPIVLDVGPDARATPDRATYSTDGGKTWQHSERGVRDGKRIHYSLTFPTETALVAWGPPFVPADAAALTKRLAAECPDATEFSLCETREGRPTPALRITSASGDKSAQNARPLIWVVARQHAWESGASWVCRGFAEWMVSDDPQAVRLREQFEVVIVPIMDIDNVHRGAGGKSQKPQDHNRDWSDVPRWRAVAAAQVEIQAAADEDRLAAFIDLHNPTSRDQQPYFYIPPKDILSEQGRQNLDTFLATAEAEITGPLRFVGRTIECGPEYDAKLWGFMSMNWVAKRGTPAVAVTLETAWNTPHSTTEGYRTVGRQLGKTLATYAATRE